MRYVLLGVVLILGTAGPVRADGGLTAAVASAYFPRNADAGLHEIASQRVAELRACGCLEHDRMRPGTAEVLAWNRGAANPIASALNQWIGSLVHHGILSNRSYGRIGCAELVDGSIHWFACILAAGPLPAGTTAGTGAGTTAAAPAPAFALPDTATATRSLGVAAMRSRPILL